VIAPHRGEHRDCGQGRGVDIACSGLVHIRIALLCVALAGGMLSAQTTTSLRLVSTAWPPFTNESGQPRFALDLVEAAFARISVSSQTAIVAAPAFTSSLLSGPFEGSAAAWKDPERERALLFSQPYLENRLILVGRRGEDVSATTMGALNGRRIAIVEGYSYGDAIAVAGPTFVRTQREEESLSQLLGGAVDYTLMDELVVRYITSNYPKESKDKLQIGTIPLITRPLHLAVRKALPDAQAIIKRFNAQILTMMVDRTYHRLLHLDWISGDVDGDGIAEYVPRSDRVGSAPPQQAYSISSSAATSKPNEGKSKFYVGGNMYSDWATIPRQYKVPDPDGPEPGRSSATLFTFRW
jgi:polar amino acid transport system substrate-binding protein